MVGCQAGGRRKSDSSFGGSWVLPPKTRGALVHVSQGVFKELAGRAIQSRLSCVVGGGVWRFEAGQSSCLALDPGPATCGEPALSMTRAC